MLISLVQNISQELEKRHTCAVVKHKRQDKTRKGEDITNWTHPLLDCDCSSLTSIYRSDSDITLPPHLHEIGVEASNCSS